MRKHTLLLLTLFAAAAPCAWLSAEPPKPVPAAADDFTRDVLPFVEKHCVACHNPQKKKADLILTIKQPADADPPRRRAERGVAVTPPKTLAFSRVRSRVSKKSEKFWEGPCNLPDPRYK